MRRAVIGLGLGLAACGDPAAVSPDATVSEHWMARAQVPRAVQETAAVALDGRIYVVAGTRGAVADREVRRYDIASDTWTQATELPAEVHHANAVLVEDRIYLVGHLRTADFLAYGDVWSWRPGDAEWQVHPMAPPRGAAVADVIDDIIYVAGGLVGGQSSARVDAYDVALETSTPRAPLPLAVDHACGAVIDGRLYVAGGRNTANTGRTFAYSPADDAWTELAGMPTRRSGTACGVIDGRLIVVGGEGNSLAPSGVFPQTEAYDPLTDTWETLEPMRYPRHGMAAAVWDGKMYVPGGGSAAGFRAVTVHDVFTP